MFPLFTVGKLTLHISHCHTLQATEKICDFIGKGAAGPLLPPVVSLYYCGKPEQKISNS